MRNNNALWILRLSLTHHRRLLLAEYYVYKLRRVCAIVENRSEVRKFSSWTQGQIPGQLVIFSEGRRPESI